ncbi:MAG: DNA internalization-related competence protein ComEC/Rec2 [Lachnospiraceae bacterium]|nr:DNA internalization-related competence protein ComEC/Rec2 [Lachnospiraceae bacterium]
MLKYFKRPLVVLLVLFLIPVFFLASYKEKILISQMHEYCEGDRISYLTAHIIKKDFKNEKYRYTVKLSGDGMFRKRHGILTSECFDLSVDDTIICDCEYAPISPAENEGCFDGEKYYAAQGISYVAEIKEVRSVKRGFFLYDALYRLRTAVCEFYRTSLYGEEIGLLSAMVLGDRGFLEVEAKQLFSDAGLAHLLAVSGLHISIVGMGLYRLLRKKGISYGVSGTVSMFVVGCYGMMTGMSTSTFRAVLMFAVMIGAELLSEAYDVGSAASLAAIIILTVSPTSLFDNGFLFSFGAVFGIVYVADPMRVAYEIARRKRFGPDFMPPRLSVMEQFFSAVIFGVGLQLSVLPIIAVSYHSFSPYVIILNIILLPFMGVLIGWGLVMGIGGAVLMSAFSIVPPAFLMLPCHCILYVYEMVSEFALRLPKSEINVGQSDLWQIVLFYFILAVAVRMIEVYSRGERRGGEVFPVVLLIISFVILVSDPSHPTEIDMLSVGQGDGLCIRSCEGEVFMVDGGSSSTDELGRYTLLPYLKYKGIDHVTYWFVTHMDADHYNGLFWLLSEGFDVEHVVLAASVEKNEGYYELIKLCDEKGYDIVYMQTGDVCGTESLRFTCLFPDYPSAFSGTNENSLCLRLDYGEFNMILTGDMGAEQEAAVMATHGLGEDIEILKAAHHGSKNSNCLEWLSEVSPELCIISAGRHNLYHHPSPDTLSRLDELGIPHLCTIDCGEIRILPERDGRFCVETMKDFL